MWGARYEALKAVLRPLWVRIVAPFALLYGTYDSTAHQFLPPETAEKFPTIYGLVSMTSGWFPWWIWLLVVIAIFFFAVIDYVARSQHAAHRSNGPAPAIPAPTTMAAPLQASPDWSLRELFFWICSELQTNAESKDREAIGREIMDKLSTGQLSAWGRRIKWPDRRREPLAPIDREYWSRSEFTYWFLKEDGDQVSSQAVPRILSRPSAYAVHDPDYADIQINKAQALTLWAAHRVGYREAATLLYEAMGTQWRRRYDRKWLLEPDNSANSLQICT